MKREAIKEFLDLYVNIMHSSAFFHIKEVGKNYIILKDRCPKGKKIGDGSILNGMTPAQASGINEEMNWRELLVKGL